MVPLTQLGAKRTEGVMGVRSLQEGGGGGRILLIGDLNICFEC